MPEKVPNVLIKFSRLGSVFSNLEQNKIPLSTYNEIRCSMSQTLIPVMSACLRIAMASGSIARTKSNGERGQPCLIPRLSLNGVDTSPLVKFSACGLEYKS